MRIYCTLLLSIVFLSFGNRASAQTWIPVGNDTKGEAVLMKVLQDDASSYQIEITINGLNDQLIEKNQERYHRLSLGKGGILLESGEPTLPTLSRLIALPTGTKAVSSVVEEEWKDIEMGTIYPGQIPPRDFKKKESFYMDKNAYSKPFIPKLVRQSEEQTWRGIRNVVISVCPFKYYPNENRLSILKKFVLHVNFEHSDSLTDVAASYEVNDGYGLFDNTVYSLPYRTQNTSSNNKYLIICKDAEIMNSQSMKEFRMWKALKGFNTQLVLLNSILSSPPTFSQDDVKAYIRNHVNSGGFVLFVGDNSKIPMSVVPSFYYYSGTIRGDYWYGYGTGTNDWEADIAIGRFSVSNLNEFSRIARRTIKYESTSPITNNTLLVAHKESPDDYLGYQFWCEIIRNAYYTEPMSFVTAYGANGATNANVISYLNTGVPIACYIGYGYANYWGGIGGTPEEPDSGWNMSGESFYGSEASNLNDSACAVIFSNCPKTANLEVNNNMLEAFTRGQKGATAFAGFTTNGNGFDDFNLYYSAYIFFCLLNDGEYLLGNLTNSANIDKINEMGGADLSKDHSLSFVCGGDPALELWTGTPQTFGDVNLNEDNSNVTITTQYYGDYKVSVAGENGDLLGTYNVVSGNTCTFPRPSVNCYIGITKHNYIPKILKYDVTTDAVQNEEITMDSYYHYTPIGFGDGVSLDIPDGPVIVKNGTKLVIKNGTGGVRFVEGFECEEGAILEVK